jgi:hypothetical protein
METKMNARWLIVLAVPACILLAGCGGCGGSRAEDADADAGDFSLDPAMDDLAEDGTLSDPPFPDADDDDPALPDTTEDIPAEDPCDPPDSVLIDGRCVSSCGASGGNTCTSNPAECDGADLLEAYDCDYCCYVTTDPPVECTPAPEPAPSTGCAFPAEVVIYGQQAWNVLGDAFRDHVSPCANYWISIPPPTSDKTQVRAGQAELMHARGPRLHAMAEFHWNTWNRFHNDTGTPWREIGHIFRTRMQDAGYCVESGDTWAINEVPSGVRTDPSARPGFINLVMGLYEGADGMTPAKGAAFIWGMGHATVNFSVYKPSVKQWLQDADFWVQMNNTVRWWGQEVYVNPMLTCVGTASIATRAGYVNDFTQHPARLAAAAPDSAGVNTAQSYFSRAYVPVMNAVWGADPSRGYGDTVIPLVQMRHHITLQARACRGWADGHTWPDGRIGFAFASYSDPTEWATLASTLAVSILGAYNDPDAGAAGACMEGGVDRWCNCNVAGAAFNDGWQTFATW